MRSFPGVFGLAIAVLIVWISIDGLSGVAKSINNTLARTFSVSAAAK